MSPSKSQEPHADKPVEGFPVHLAKDSRAAVVDIFDSRTATPEKVTKSLIKNGGCVIRGIVSPDHIAEITRDVRPHILKDQPWEGEFFPPETRRVTGLVEKSPRFTKSVLGNSLYQTVSNTLLTSTHKHYLGQKLEVSVSPPQVNNTIVFSIAPGAARQELHRDDQNFHNELPSLASHEDYTIGRDCALGFFVAGKKTTKANGATRFIPRSHLWPITQPPNEELCYYAELEPGDGFMMLASAYHGGSANTTIDQERLVFSCFMTKGIFRQEENQFLANSLKSLKQYDRTLQGIVGYNVSMPWLGWVDYEDPRNLLLDEGEKRERLH
ncbi:Dioxygenase himG [Hyphodiscus hymeniophilus]|uniref:Dioxygenase himG n=1 Tax=Hyphodiscus hymeniophilus TaxID=353542 RepID=A0A9P6VKG8_9HELO|nr:Dioxygenase himG [Hyphodiscus hymeniophilus]